MCQSCWIGDHGMPAVAADEVFTAAWLIEHLYVDLDEGTGGPLHDVLDDMNIDGDADGSISGTSRGQAAMWHSRFDYLWDGRFDRWAQAGYRTTDAHKLEIQHTCEAIIHLFDQMPVPHRAAAIAWAFGWVKDAMPEWAERKRTGAAWHAAETDAAELLATVAEWPPPEERTPPGPKGCVTVPCPPFMHDADPDAPSHVVEVDADLRADYEGLFAGQDVRLLRDDGRPDADAVNRFTEEFLASGGIIVQSDEGKIDLSSPPLLGTGDGPEFKWSTHWVIHPDGRIEGTHWTAEDVIAAVGFRPAVPGEQVTVHTTYSAQARRALGELREE